MAAKRPGLLALAAIRIKRVIARNLGLLDEKAWLQAGYGPSSYSGKSVTFDSALQVATFWSCVRLISETVATLPMMVYQTNTDGSRTVAFNDPLYDLLHSAPSADFSALEFWEGMALSLCLTGNAYAKKQFIGARLVSLDPLRADLMTIKRNSRNERVYCYRDPDGYREYAERDIFHIRGFGGAGDYGLSPVQYARQSLGNAMAADELAGSMYANGVRPTGVMTIDRTLNPGQRERLKQNVLEPMVGMENAGGVMLLEAGMKWQPMTMSFEDSQFLETRGFNVEEICRWFRIPPFMVGHTEKNTSWGSGLEQQMIMFLTMSLTPYLRRIEMAIERSLVPPGKRGILKAEFKVEGLLRSDSKSRSAFYAVMVQNGIMTRNEVRRLENLPPMEGGDKLTVQAQNVPLGQNSGTMPDDEDKQ